MYDFNILKMSDIIRMGSDIRVLGKDCRSMEEAAQRLVNYLFDNFVDPQSGLNTCPLIRFFKTHDHTTLPPELQRFAARLLTDKSPTANYKCLTLLATTGIEEKWRRRQNSQAHQAIPLPSKEVVNRIPMMRNLIKQMGMDIETVIRPDPNLLLDLARTTFNIFYVQQALASPYIPAQQEFVKPYGIKSVLGYGGILPSGNIFTVIMFTRKALDRKTAQLFSTVALNVKMLMLPFDNNVFATKIEGETTP
ncbi:MAG: hypothetical protein PHQ27_01130 [Victivallales bacterium]|nr:hypothetical protein [Victivallales bacterium]